MKRVAVFHHYLHPDPNVSSVHFSELCSGLAARGWQVTAFPSNRNLDHTEVSYPASEIWNDVTIRRVWRPSSGRSSALGRIFSAIWMIVRWSLLALRHNPDAIIIGTDPILSVCIAVPWRVLRPRTTIALWCFDLYPEVAIADGLLRPDGLPARLIRRLLRRGYGACDLLADIGPCMRTHLRRYVTPRRETTLVPWALTEPATALPLAAEERSSIFGPAPLALLYSGTFGRAHSSEDLLELMRLLEDTPAHLAFSVKGQRESTLREAAAGRPNVSFVPFASKDRLDDRLAAPDVHVVSLRERWTGMVIPSKFFGAIAVGRPVLFCGSPDSSIARWIQEYGLGWVLAPGQAATVAVELRALLADPGALRESRLRCHQVYQEHFCRRITLDRWNLELGEARHAR